jgi:hypothetical protein
VSTDAAALESRLEAITADSITSITLDDTHTSWHARFGFELNQRFSLEAAYYDFGNVTGNIQANATNPTAFAAPVPAEFPRDPHGPALQARVRWPIADETALAVRAGMIRWSSDQRAQLVTGGTGAFEDSDDDTDVVWGVELAWQRWRRFGLVLELNGAKDDSSARSLDLGLVWKLR